VEIAVMMPNLKMKYSIGVIFLLISLIFVYRSFFGMRIPEDVER